MRHFVALFFAFILTTSSSYAQSVILQGGPWTPGHSPMYLGQGSSQPIVQDSGPASGGALGLGLSEQLLVNRANTYPAANAGTGPLGTNWCDYDAPTTNSTGYHFLCLSANAQGGGLLTYGAGGTATALPFQFLINGQSFTFPLSISSLTPIPANTVVGNASNSSASPAAIPIAQCLNALTYTSGDGFGCNTLAGTGTVTSVGLTLPPIFTVVGSPITSFGTLAASLADQNANLVFAGPGSGSADTPTFRSLVSADLPVISGANFGAQSANTVFAGPSSGGSAQPGFRALVGADFGTQSANTALMGPSSGTAAPAFRQPTAGDVSFTQSGTGAVAQTVQSKLSEWISTADFGAKCDGSTDDTAAIQAAHNAALAQHKALFIQPSSNGNGCIVSKTGTINGTAYALLFDARVPVYGWRGLSIVQPSPSMDNATDIFYVQGSVASYTRWVFNGITIGNPSAATSPGCTRIYLDTSTAGALFPSNSEISDNYLQQSKVTGGGCQSIVANNNSSSNPDGGFTRSRISNNQIGQGISLNGVGDSITSEYNVFFSTDGIDAIYVNLAPNAGNFRSFMDNFSQNSIFLQVDCAQTFYVSGGELEHQNLGNGAPIIDITGGICTPNGGSIIGEQMQSLTGSGGQPPLIAIIKGNGIYISGNTLATPTNYAPIDVGGGGVATNITIGPNAYIGNTTHVSNSGASTSVVSTTACGSTC